MATQHQVTFSHYDTAEYLQTEEEIAAYLEAVMEENDPSLLAAALGDVARARNMSQLAKDVGMSREGLYKALSGEGNPAFSTINKVANALGLQLTIKPMSPPPAH
ncbi:addiction module antidote protein [Halomonas sp. 3H]|uniref:addiction module antidote protein n=1 Tax=Halomonas sp. 3H TaxID=2952527 RepID=UPI0020B65861|nr:addiction module antidote protein [Halomonas sp. 3H]